MTGTLPQHQVHTGSAKTVTLTLFISLSFLDINKTATAKVGTGDTKNDSTELVESFFCYMYQNQSLSLNPMARAIILASCLRTSINAIAFAAKAKSGRYIALSILAAALSTRSRE